MMSNTHRPNGMGYVRPLSTWTSATSPDRGLPERDEYHACSTTVLLLRVLRAVGLAPVTFKKDRFRYAVTISNSSALYYSYTKFATIGVIILIGLANEIYSIKYRNARLLSVPWATNVIFGWWVIAACTIQNRKRTTRLLSYLKQVQEIFKLVEEKTLFEVQDKRIKIQLALILVGGSILLSGKSISLLAATHNPPNFFIGAYYLVLSYLTNVISSLIELQVVYVIQYQQMTLQALNKRLTILSTELQLHDTVIRDAKSLGELKDINESYLCVRDLLKQVYKSEGLLLISKLVFTIVHLNINFYYLHFYSARVLKLSYHEAILVVGKLLFCIFDVGRLLLLIEPCHGAHQELGNSRLLVSELLCCASSALSPLALLLQHFAVQLQQDTTFAPFGLFNFSRSLYTAVIGSVSTFYNLLATFKVMVWQKI